MASICKIYKTNFNDTHLQDAHFIIFLAIVTHPLTMSRGVEGGGGAEAPFQHAVVFSKIKKFQNFSVDRTSWYRRPNPEDQINRNGDT